MWQVGLPQRQESSKEFKAGPSLLAEEKEKAVKEFALASSGKEADREKDGKSLCGKGSWNTKPGPGRFL